MIFPAASVLYTQDSDFIRRVRAFLRTMVEVRVVEEAERLHPVLEQNNPTVLLLDLRVRESRRLLEQVQVEWPEVLIIGFGVPRSDPFRDAEQADLYATVDVNLDRQTLQGLVARALDHLRVLEDNRALRAQISILPGTVNHPIQPPRESQDSSFSLLRLPRGLRNVDSGERLMERIIENLADSTKVTRLGIFCRAHPDESYRLQAGIRCFRETYQLEYRERDPLVRWLERHAHLVYRGHLHQLIEHRQKDLLRRALDTFGAEVIVPLHAQSKISGWLFFGHRTTGRAFDDRDLEILAVLGEQVSIILENSSLHEQVTRQKTLAETLLAAIPPGIVATDENAIIRWCNQAAESVLDVSHEEVVNKPVEAIGSRIASLLREALASNVDLPSEQWIDPSTRRSLSVQTRRLTHDHQPVGAVAIIQDMTPEEALRQKQELVDRAAFWTDLAASMSHEVRNPLVAIKTFAQLLPERFDDADFRRDFNEIVVQEIDRLDLIITQINDFAHPPELNFKSIDLRAPMKRAVELARARKASNGFSVETSLPDDLPPIVGDESALAEAFAQLVANAAEATHGLAKGRITLSARPVREGEHTSGVVVTVHDNGPGIAADLKDKIFSPFCTTKPRGMGLGLPIVKRTVFDHNGRVDIDSNPQGTSVSVLLPVADNGDRQ